MHSFIRFCTEISRNTLVLDVIEYMVVRVHFRKVPVFVRELGTFTGSNVFLPED